MKQNCFDFILFSPSQQLLLTFTFLDREYNYNDNFEILFEHLRRNDEEWIGLKDWNYQEFWGADHIQSIKCFEAVQQTRHV